MREITWCVEGALNVVLQSFSSTSIYRIGLQKLSTQSHLRPFSTAFVLRMRRNGYLWTSGVNLNTAVRFADPDFRLECKISAIWRRFPLISYAECPPYFYFRFVWPTDLESIPHASTPTSIIPTKFQVDMTIHCRVIAFLSADTSRTLWPWPLTNLATKFLDPTPIRSWVMNYNVSRLLPLKMRTRSLRMRGITWPVSRGWKTIIFLESATFICLFTIQLRWLYDVYN